MESYIFIWGDNEVNFNAYHMTSPLGELMTAARWMREFVANHPEYKHDSVISEEMNYSLMWKCNQIAQEQVECPELLGVGLNKLKYSEIKATS